MSDGRFSLQPTSQDFDVYATTAAAVTATGNSTFGVTRAVRCESAGDLAVKRASDGVTVILPFSAGETQPLQITGVVASGSTTAGRITVYR